MNGTGTRFNTDETTDVTVVSFHGRLDLDGVDEIEEQFRAVAADALRVLVDLREVDYVSSSAIRMILGKMRSVRSNGGQMALCRLQPLVHKVFEMTKLDSLIPIHTTRAEAVEDLRRRVP